MRNVALLEQTMQQIKDHPEQHYQASWLRKQECGTAACFAGWACLLSGLKAEERELGFWIYVDGEPLGIAGAARDLLGITYGEAAILFEGTNTIAELELMVKDLVNGDELGSNTYYEELAK